jgi:tellurite resistance protein
MGAGLIPAHPDKKQPKSDPAAFIPAARYTEPTAMTHTAPTPARLSLFPVSFFSTVMGTAGLAIAWQKAHLVLGAPAEVGQWLLAGLAAAGLFDTTAPGSGVIETIDL